MSPNEQAFLDMLAMSEGTAGVGDNGYNVLVGGDLFTGYIDHPRIRIWLPRLSIYSTAAGRYQILARFFDAYKAQLNLPDFSHDSQDAIAMQMIKECGALPDINSGYFEHAVELCASRWASLPGANYGQHENRLDTLRVAYTNAGGTLA